MFQQFWVLDLDVLVQGAFRAVGFLAFLHLANVMPGNLIGGPAHTLAPLFVTCAIIGKLAGEFAGFERVIQSHFLELSNLASRFFNLFPNPTTSLLICNV